MGCGCDAAAIRGTTIVSEEFLAERSGHPPVTACKLDIDDPSRKGECKGTCARQLLQ